MVKTPEHILHLFLVFLLLPLNSKMLTGNIVPFLRSACFQSLSNVALMMVRRVACCLKLQHKLSITNSASVIQSSLSQVAITEPYQEP